MENANLFRDFGVSPNASYLGQVDEPYDPQPSGSGLPTGGKVMVTTPY
jgi:hypothetical protein